jgi:type I pantothenate kinase
VTAHDLAALVPPDARVVAITGPVSVGKSTFAELLGSQLQRAGRGPAEVITTDGFLFPNMELEARGILERKGFPESYDIVALAGFVAAVRADDTDIPVPEYSHFVFDVVEGRRISAPRVAILEGVNALQPDVGSLADVTIYLEAPDDAVIQWYVERFVELTRKARATGEGFYVRFASMDDDGVAHTARAVWDAINGPNLEAHIRPTKSRASIVVVKGADHSIERVELATGRELG